MRLATVEQSRHIDELSQEAYGLSAEVLMESAGCLAAREISQAYLPEIVKGSIAIFCGPGHNGADALVVARHLHSAGYRNLLIICLGDPGRPCSLLELQLDRAKRQGLKAISLKDFSDYPTKVSLIVDGLFGIGLSRPLEGIYAEAVRLMNSSSVPIVALDTPSGLNCNTGLVLGPVIKADMTLTFGLPKPGFFVSEGPLHIGKLRVLPIGFPFECLRGVATSHFLFNERLARRYLPKRAPISHKAQHGHLLLLAGSPGMWGAGALSALSAYRMGVGYVTWASTDIPPNCMEQAPEVLTAKWENLNLENKKYTAIALGPGLGLGIEVGQWISELKKKTYPVVIDADGITACVNEALFPLPSHWVLTPHAGELSRILGISVGEIEQDRYAAVLKASQVTGCHVLLKGFRSILAFNGRCMVIYAGNSALAKAGTGDVLTGMIGGLLAQKVQTLQAVGTAAYLHGRLADEWIRTGHDPRSLVASDLSQHLPQLMARIAGSHIFGSSV